MGLLSSIAGLAAPILGTAFGGPIGGAIGSALGGAIAGSGGSRQSGTTTTTQQQTIDPRMQAYLYGDGTANNPGLLSQIAGSANQPRSAGSAAFGSAADQFLGANGGAMLNGQLATANQLQAGGISAPRATAAQGQAAQGQAAQGNAALGSAVYGQAAQGQAAQGQAVYGQAAQGQAAQGNAANVGAAPLMKAARADFAGIAAPSQNSLNLSGAYDRMINGDAGANPYLTSALQSAVNQTNASYAQNQADLTNTLTRSVLPQISSNAVLAGQYGGSRQGIAEGNALSDYTKQMTNANLQLGLANSANTTGQQANAFNAGQDRSLNALNTLSGQQYGVATNNAQLAQQASLANAANQQAANSQNSAQQLQTNLANAGFTQQSNLANLSNQQQTNMANLSNTQQMNLANMNNGQQMNLTNLGNQQQANMANLGNTQQMNLANMNNGQQMNLANLGNQQQASMANLGNNQQMNLANLGNSQQMNLANLGNNQQTSLANMQSQLATNQLNSTNQVAGLGASANLLGAVNMYGNANDMYQINRNGQVASQLAPFTGLNSAVGTSTPLYTNPLGNAIGGAAAGLGLYSAYNQANNGAWANTMGNFASNNAAAMAQSGLSANDLLGAFG